MSSEEKQYWLALAKTGEIGPVRYKKISKYFGQLSDFWRAGLPKLIDAGLDRKTAERLIYKRKEIEPGAELEKLEKAGVSLCTLNDPEYPSLLKETYSPPLVLFYFGRLPRPGDFPLAIVGTRKITSYGRLTAEMFSGELARFGLSIISGLALGIDACAHRGALMAGGKTLAILGSGADLIYPAANRNLAREMIEKGGAVITEFPLGTRPFKGNFPRRNRVIAGLSLGTLVIEAAPRSGALITARYALENNRDVFALPGNIFSENSFGPNELIKQGARPVSQSAEIIEALNLRQITSFKAAIKILPEDPNEKIIYELIGAEPTAVDKILNLSHLNISLINSTLAMMEMKGLVKNLGNQLYVRAR